MDTEMCSSIPPNVTVKLLMYESSQSESNRIHVIHCFYNILYIKYTHALYLYIIFRYLDLTEEEKDKLKGSYKVAKKLEKLEGIGQYR